MLQELLLCASLISAKIAGILQLQELILKGWLMLELCCREVTTGGKWVCVLRQRMSDLRKWNKQELAFVVTGKSVENSCLVLLN